MLTAARCWWFNPCDGWHDGFVRAREEDGEVYHVGIYPWMGSEMLPHDFYFCLTKISWQRISSQRSAVGSKTGSDFSYCW
ncbi:hypothetical protein CS370_07605 (plasmid) [Serratia marcescens]|nr:hypothetical protein CS370_07605 [Serratia marcescens]